MEKLSRPPFCSKPHLWDLIGKGAGPEEDGPLLSLVLLAPSIKPMQPHSHLETLLIILQAVPRSNGFTHGSHVRGPGLDQISGPSLGSLWAPAPPLTVRHTQGTPPISTFRCCLPKAELHLTFLFPCLASLGMGRVTCFLDSHAWRGGMPTTISCLPFMSRSSGHCKSCCVHILQSPAPAPAGGSQERYGWPSYK